MASIGSLCERSTQSSLPFAGKGKAAGNALIITLFCDATADDFLVINRAVTRAFFDAF